MRFVGKGLHHPNAAHRILDPRIKLAQVVKEVGVSVGHLLVKVDRHPAHNRDNRKGQQGQLPVDPGHEPKGADQRHDRNKDIFWPMMRQLTDHVEVGGNAGDQVTGLVVVKKAKREFLNMVERPAAHLGLDVDAKHMAPIGDDILQHGIQRIDAQQPRCRQQDQRPIFAGQQPVNKLVDRQRKPQFQKTDNNRAGKIQKEEMAVWLIVSNKLTNHG